MEEQVSAILEAIAWTHLLCSHQLLLINHYFSAYHMCVLNAGLMMSRAGDIRCIECSLVDNMRAGAELNRMLAPYNTTGTMNGTVIAINSRAMKPFTTPATSAAESGATRKRSLRDTTGLDTLPSSGLPHFQRDDPDRGTTFGWYASWKPCTVWHELCCKL